MFVLMSWLVCHAPRPTFRSAILLKFHFITALQHFRAEEWIAERWFELNPLTVLRRAGDSTIHHGTIENLRGLERLRRSQLLRQFHCRHAEGEKGLARGRKVLRMLEVTG